MFTINDINDRIARKEFMQKECTGYVPHARGVSTECLFSPTLLLHILTEHGLDIMLQNLQQNGKSRNFSINI